MAQKTGKGDDVTFWIALFGICTRRVRVCRENLPFYSSEAAQPIVFKFGTWLDTYQSNPLEESEAGSHRARAYPVFKFEEFPVL